MLKALIAMGLALVLAVSAAFWQADRAGEYKAKAQEATDALTSLQDRQKRIQSQLTKVQSNYATSQLRLDQALRGRPAVATPPDVYRVLCERARCVPMDPVHSPGD